MLNVTWKQLYEHYRNNNFWPCGREKAYCKWLANCISKENLKMPDLIIPHRKNTEIVTSGVNKLTRIPWLIFAAFWRFPSKTKVMLTVTTPIFNHLVILLIIWQTTHPTWKTRFDFLSAASKKFDTEKLSFLLMCEVTTMHSRLDYQSLFGKGARAPPPNSRLDSWTYRC